MLTCREIIEFLDRYSSGELSFGERARFDEHLAVCPSCVAYLAQYERTVAAGRDAFREDAAAAAPPELVEAILRARAGR
jgi:anti-sigma factor RsiW